MFKPKGGGIKGLGGGGGIGGLKRTVIMKPKGISDKVGAFEKFTFLKRSNHSNFVFNGSPFISFLTCLFLYSSKVRARDTHDVFDNSFIMI